MARILSRLLTDRVFAALGHAQRAAIAEALMVTVVAPGPTPDADRLTLRRQLVEMNWAVSPPGEEDQLPEVGRRELRRSEDPDHLLLLGSTLARALADARARELTFKAMVGLVFADGGNDRELVALEPLRVGLEITKARAHEVADELKDELVRMLV